MFVDRDFRLPRLWSNRELKKIAYLFSGDIVNVSASDDKDKEGGFYKNYFINARNYYYTNYYGYRGFQNRLNEYHLDLQNDLPEHLIKRFDVVFNHTTLEHIFNVNKAFSNLCLISKDVVIIIVPFVQIEHKSESYNDFWRFTPSCLRYSFKEYGFEVIYESANRNINSSIYLFFVGTRNPEKWSDSLPKYYTLDDAGGWIRNQWYIKILKKIINS